MRDADSRKYSKHCTGSRSNILPGAIMIGLLGLAGQGGYNAITDANHAESTPVRSLMQQVMESKWMPLKPLSDEQYEGILNEKLLRTEVEISIIDEKIAALQASPIQNPLVS